MTQYVLLKKCPLTFILILTAYCIYTDSAVSQFDTTRTINKVNCIARVAGIWDENHVPFGNYVRVGQFFDNDAVMYVFGEVNVRNQTGDTLTVWFDHALTKKWNSEKFNVYVDNSLDYENELITKPFILSNSDTLVYYREAHVQFSVLNEDQSERTIEQDTLDFNIPDSVLFRIDLIDDSTHLKLTTIDSTLFLPSQNFYTLDQSILPSVPRFDSVQFIEQRWRATFTSGSSRRVRLRLTPIYLPQLNSRFQKRAMKAEFNWSPRVSAYWKDRIRQVGKKFEHIKDSLLNTYHLKGENNHEINIFPNVIDKFTRFITVRNNAKNIDEIKISLYTIAGEKIFSEHYINQNNEVIIQLPFLPFSSGMLLCILQIDDMLITRSIIIK